MKKIVYGVTGYGKSFNYVSPVIEKNKNVLLITPNLCVKSEVNYMGLPDDILKNITVKDIPNIVTGKYGLVECGYKQENLIELLNVIEASKINDDEDLHIIFMSIGSYGGLKLIERINHWKCNITCEHTCHSKSEAEDELDFQSPIWHGWHVIPVFNRLYIKRDEVGK